MILIMLNSIPAPGNPALGTKQIFHRFQFLQQSLECNAHTALESSKKFLQDQAVVAAVGGMHSLTYLMAPRSGPLRI